MSKRMLVDASHPEETRVVVLDGNKVEEFDYESASRRPLKGNIYLAKVTRVEPSLQACFVDYGGNRHGFLAFSEIHPDYYQIPTADRQALLEANRAAQRAEDIDDDEDSGGEDEVEITIDETPADETGEPAAEVAVSTPIQSDVTTSPSEPSLSDDGTNGSEDDSDDVVEVVAGETEDVWVHDPETEEDASAQQSAAEANGNDQTISPEAAEEIEDAAQSDSETADVEDEITPIEAAEAAEAASSEGSAEPNGNDAREELPRPDYRSLKRYKIQEVIKRRQVLLVQVVKEERGNKGAALTTYLSLAGRYCVLMPNTDRGGGISRKISNVSDRRKLKEMAGELEVPEGMGVIIRTAGANRTKQEITRDFEYLMRQWDAVRDLTLRSTAPTLVYEEDSLIKRTIRDLYSKDIGDVLVEGDDGFGEAHSFMNMLMPSHAESVRHYRDPVPLFQKYGVEAALDSMFNPVVRLRSGGYIVINQTEALVAVDVNSGKATREHHIEDTALKTNLEAAEEIARQLRLRDLAGLVVIDFIDMEEHRNNRAVEKRLKDCLRHDRARIQLGRISPFGLLEMSRQRLRAGMIEGATIPCPHCEGRGVIRSVGSMALRVLRAVEEYCQRERLQAITLRVPPEIALYILNHKRAQLTAIEDRRGVYIYIESKPSLAASSYEIERGANVPFEPRKAAAAAVTVESELEINDDVGEEAEEGLGETDSAERDEGEHVGAARGEDGGKRRRRRRRRGRDRERGSDDAEQPGSAPQAEPASAEGRANGEDGEHPVETRGEDGEEADFAGDADSQDGDGRRRRRRRGRRGRRGRKPEEGAAEAATPRPSGSPIGHLPTPAEAFDAPDWPGTGGFDTRPGEAPPTPRAEPPAGRVAPDTALALMPESPAGDQPKPDDRRAADRPSLASFFGFGGKSEEGAPAEERPQRKGWWQKRADS